MPKASFVLAVAISVTMAIVTSTAAFAEKSSGQQRCIGSEVATTASGRTSIRVANIELHYEYDSYMGAPSVKEGISWDFDFVVFDRVTITRDKIPSRLIDDLRIYEIELSLDAVMKGGGMHCRRVTRTNGLVVGAGQGVGWTPASLPEWEDMFTNCAGEQAKQMFKTTFWIRECHPTSVRLNHALQQIEDYLVARDEEKATVERDEQQQRAERDEQQQRAEAAEREATRAEEQTTPSAEEDQDAGSQDAARSEHEWNREVAEAQMRQHLAEQQRMRADPYHAMAHSFAKMDPTSQKAFLGVLLGVMGIAVGLLVVNQVADDPETGAVMAGVVSGMLTSGGFIGATLRHLRSPSSDSDARTSAVTGERGWFWTGSYRFALVAGFSTPTIVDEAGESHDGNLAGLGFQAALRYSLLRLSLSTLYRTGKIDGRDHQGLDTGIGLGIQVWRGGLLSPYAEARFGTYGSSTDELVTPTLDSDISGIDFVVGNTSSFTPLGFRQQDRARSRFFLDVSYVVRGRVISSGQMIFALGFDRAW